MRKLKLSLLLGVTICLSATVIFAQSGKNVTGKVSKNETVVSSNSNQSLKTNTSKDVNSSIFYSEVNHSPYKPTWQYGGSKGGQIYSNGPLSNSSGTGAGGEDESIMESTTLGFSNYGFGFQLSGTTRNRVAEDFYINATSWDIDSIVFFGYQTGSTIATSTFTSMNLRIWNGDPSNAASLVVWGDTTTNILDTSYFSGVYRVIEGSSGNTDRPIMRLVCSTSGLNLTGGTYWVDYQAAGSLTSGPWAPPIAILGQTNTGNAVQRASFAWAPIVDVATQGLPFIIYGTINGAFTDDIGVASITSPVSSAALTNAENIEVSLTNFSSTPQSGFDVAYSINGQTAVTETFSGTLPANGTASFTFSTPEDFSSPGSIYNIKAYTKLTSDQNTTNDTAYAVVQNLFGVICSAGASSCDEYIDTVNFANISNLVSGCGLVNGYSDFTDDTADIVIGTSYALDVYNPTPYSGDIAGAWFDWNQNGDFSDPGEFYQLTSADAHYFTANVTVPNWAVNGDARMRLRIQYGGTLSPCGVTSYGEVEDYTVNITGTGIACDVATESIDMTTTVEVGTVDPKATFINLGSQTQTFDVTMTIAGGYTSTKTITSLAPGYSQQVTFDPWTAAIGNYDVEVYTTLACDANNNNDTLNANIDVITLNKVYLYVAYDATSVLPEGPGISSLQIPGDITSLASTTSSEFICGGAWAENKWYAAEYKSSTGGGNLYTIDTVTGTMTIVGNMGESINGISYDPVNHIMYGVSSTSLYTINLNTGVATLVGDGGIANSIFIALACNLQGELFTFSIDDSKLYSLNAATGVATLIGDIGFTAAYAQDMEFDINTGILYMAAYNDDANGGELRTVDISTGATTLINTFMNDAEICGFAIPHAPISSINEIAGNANFTMYPNPATDVVYISSNEIITSVRLVNTLSQVVFETASNDKMVNINTSDIKPGLYFIQIKTAKGLQTKHIVINK